MKEYTCSRLVKSEDLNHHGTLFAGRTTEWIVESAFISAASLVGNPKKVVCINVHGLVFKSPITKGSIITLKSRVVKLGKTSITVYTHVCSELTNMIPVEGFLTFVSVDDEGNKTPHGLVLDETTDELELQIRAKAEGLK